MARIKELAIRMAKENPSWGYTRIVGALANLGHEVARTTVAKILNAAGIAPAPDQPSSYRTFLKAHAGAIDSTGRKLGLGLPVVHSHGVVLTRFVTKQDLVPVR